MKKKDIETIEAEILDVFQEYDMEMFKAQGKYGIGMDYFISKIMKIKWS